MANLVVGMWFKDYVHHAVSNVGEMGLALRTKIEAAFDGKDDDDQCIFMVPEFYFTKNQSDDTRVRWLSPDEKAKAIELVNSLSLIRKNLLVVGGSICSYQTQPQNGKDNYLIANEAPVAYNGKPCTLYQKTEAAGETSSVDALILYKLEKGTIDLRVVTTKTGTALCCIPWKKTKVTAPVVDLTSPGGLWQGDGTDGGMAHTRGTGFTSKITVGGEKANRKVMPRIRYERGAASGKFKVPGTGVTWGIEVCAEHTVQTLKKNVGGDGLDFHILVSNTVSYTPSSVHLCENGYFLHCDALGCHRRLGLNANVIVQKVKGQLVDRTKENPTRIEDDCYTWSFALPT